MTQKIYLSQKELAKKTGLKHSQIDYLVRENIIPCNQYGKAIPRKYPINVLGIVEKWKKERGIQ